MRRTLQRSIGIACACGFVTAAAAQPANDLCSGAMVVGVGTSAFDNTGATTQGPLSQCNIDASGNGGDGDVWFQFTVPSSGWWLFDTCGTTGLADTCMQLFTGTCGSLTEVGCNDDAGGTCGGASQLLRNFNAGQVITLRIAAFDENTAYGAGVLNIASSPAPPANDTCANAQPLSLGVVTPFDTTLAVNDTTSPGCGGASAPDVYFSYTPTFTGPYTVNTCGSTFDTVLSRRVGAGCSTIQACNDDGPCGVTNVGESELTSTLLAGTTYFFVVDGFSGARGPGQIVINLANSSLAGAPNNPAPVEMTTFLMTVSVTVANPPVSTGVGVTADLSSIGGSSTTQFFDNGTNGDVAAGDLVFSRNVTLTSATIAGPQSCPFSVSDAQGRTASGNFNFTVSAGPSGACCAASGCTLDRQALCLQGSGTWQGAGTSCGGASLAITTGGAAYASIATTGTVNAVLSNCDDCFDVLTIPFNFDFLGTPNNSVTATSNGTLQFGGTDIQWENTALPDGTSPNNALYPLWDDLNSVLGGAASAVYTQTVGSAPTRQFIVSFEGISHFGLTTPDSNNFQAVLFEGSNVVQFRYGPISAEGTNFASYSIGWEDATGATGGSFPPASLGTGNMSLTLTPTTTGNPCSLCDSIDFNGDGLFPDTLDIDDFLSVFSGGACSNDPSCGDIDFNNDGLFPDTLDIDALLSVFSGGACLT